MSARKIGIVMGLLVAVGITLAVKHKERAKADAEVSAVASRPATPPCCAGQAPATLPATQPAASPATTAPAAKQRLPRLVDVGAGKCIPCKRMAPILEELKKEFAGRMEVEFVDMWKDPRAAEPYGVLMIPTQIFYDATGKERFRHEGFFSREDILGKWKELGVDLGAGRAAAAKNGEPK